MIKIEKLTKKYGSLLALENISLEIKDKEIFVLLGLNGAGKSSLIKILCTLENKTSGKVVVNDIDLDSEKERIRKILNLSPQETAVANNLTVRENLDFIASLYDITNKDKEIDFLIEKFSLKSKENVRAKTLSGGQKRKLSLAMALITKPQILILDEPTLGLDIKSRKELWKIINDYKSQATILMTTHYLEEAEHLADSIAILDKGKVVIAGTLPEILQKTGFKDLETVFLEMTGEEVWTN